MSKGKKWQYDILSLAAIIMVLSCLLISPFLNPNPKDWLGNLIASIIPNLAALFASSAGSYWIFKSRNIEISNVNQKSGKRVIFIFFSAVIILFLAIYFSVFKYLGISGFKNFVLSFCSTVMVSCFVVPFTYVVLPQDQKVDPVPIPTTVDPSVQKDPWEIDEWVDTLEISEGNSEGVFNNKEITDWKLKPLQNFYNIIWRKKKNWEEDCEFNAWIKRGSGNEEKVNTVCKRDISRDGEEFREWLIWFDEVQAYDRFSVTVKTVCKRKKNILRCTIYRPTKKLTMKISFPDSWDDPTLEADDGSQTPTTLKWADRTSTQGLKIYSCTIENPPLKKKYIAQWKQLSGS